MSFARLTGNFFEELMAAAEFYFFCMAKLESFVMTKVTSRHSTHMPT